MERLKNIQLFYGENAREREKKIHAWRDLFMEKHWDMNLLEVYRENMSESMMADAKAMGFMGSARMMIFHDLLHKTDTDEDEESDKKKKESEIQAQWIKTLQEVPETNFILFVGNKKPLSDLEKWLHEYATMQYFEASTPREMQNYVIKELWLNPNQAAAFCDRLGFYEEIKFGKSIVIGKPDFIYQEVAKLQLAGKKQWTNEELKRILPDYREENVFDLMRPLWDRQPRDTYQLFQNLMATADHELTMATIITMLRKTLIAATFPGKLGSLPITDGQKKTGKSLMPVQKNLKELYDNIVSVDIAEKSWELPGKKEAFLMALLGFCI